jgi:hypothetical protein
MTVSVSRMTLGEVMVFVENYGVTGNHMRYQFLSQEFQETNSKFLVVNQNNEILKRPYKR